MFVAELRVDPRVSHCAGKRAADSIPTDVSSAARTCAFASENSSEKCTAIIDEPARSPATGGVKLAQRFT